MGKKPKELPSIPVYTCDKGTRVKIRQEWQTEPEKKHGVLLSSPVWWNDGKSGWWVMVVWDGEAKPDTIRVAALEVDLESTQ
jgi:hypothetical protein